MTRLTDKNSIVPRDMMNAEYAKLADLEDIEEELGIDLITLFMALKNGIYDFAGKRYIQGLYHNEFGYFLMLNKDVFEHEEYIVKVKDYSKTWALTKEELENGKKM